MSAYVSNDSVPAADLPSRPQAVYAALTSTAQGQQEEPKAELVPAVTVRKSVTPDAIICLEDGKAFESLKRHIRTIYDMTLEQYRAKWNLPPITRWLRQTMLGLVPSLLKRWDSANSARMV